MLDFNCESLIVMPRRGNEKVWTLSLQIIASHPAALRHSRHRWPQEIACTFNQRVPCPIRTGPFGLFLSTEFDVIS